MRPTGRLHIGHYFGALQNWVKLQSDPTYQCFYFVADWHALTSDYADTSEIAENSLQITIDFLASGLDPDKSVIFLQSQVPEHAELHLLLSMITPLGWLERIPTYKEQLENIQNKDLHTYGFLGYPTLQTADIVMYSAMDQDKRMVSLNVPVGEDQVSHVEFSRELVRRFNAFYGLSFNDNFYAAVDLWSEKLPGKDVVERHALSLLFRDVLHGSDSQFREKQEVIRMVRKYATEMGVTNFLDKYDQRREYASFHNVLSEPHYLLTPTPRVPGLDGRKMSKSYGNAITLSECDSDIRSKTKVMVTDPDRKRRSDPGNPDICPVYDWHKLFSNEARDPGRLAWVRNGCTTAGIGCIECKSAMADNLIKWIAPIREKRLKYEQNPRQVMDILDAGSSNARKSAQQTMFRVRESVLHGQSKRAELSK
jgi:tryptophanyl-tRNA synthetase